MVRNWVPAHTHNLYRYYDCLCCLRPRFQLSNPIQSYPITTTQKLVLLKKGLSYNVLPTLKSEKPTFLLEKHDGKMPCLVHKDFSITESMDIAEYIERTFPHSSLTRQGTFSYQEILEKTAGLWPAIGAFIKNKEEAKDDVLLATVTEELDKLDEIVRSSPGKYLCGIELTLADLYLLPQFFHAVVAMDHFKGVVCRHTHIHTYTNTYIHTHVHTYTYTYTYTTRQYINTVLSTRVWQP